MNVAPPYNAGPVARGARPRFAWKTGYESDEIAMGVAIAIALHLVPLGLIVLKAKFPTILATEIEPPARSVIAASLLKLGKPLDPKSLPDRVVPRARTAPHKEIVASRDEPKKSIPDAGAPPPPNTKDSDIKKLISKTDPFAEDAGKAKPEVGHAAGIEGGDRDRPEQGPRRGHVHGQAHRPVLPRPRWTDPERHLAPGRPARLCVSVFQVTISARMVIWHLKQSDPVKKSGNDLFDDSAREMLQKLLDDRTPLPEPPPEVQDAYRGKALSIALSGATHGEGKCN